MTELGHVFPAIYGKNLLPSNGPVLLKVVIPLDGDASHINPRCYRESAMLEVNWFDLLQIFEKCFQAFWYCFKVEGLTHILIRLFICAWSLPVVDAEGPLQVVVASRNSQGDEALPANGTKRQRDSLIYLVHEWLWIWYYTASLSEQGVLWASWFLDLYRFACLSHTQLLGCHSWNWHIYLPSRFQKSEWRWWLDKIQEKLYFLFSNHPETQWRTIFLPKVAAHAILLASVNRLSDSEECFVVDRNRVFPLWYLKNKYHILISARASTLTVT